MTTAPCAVGGCGRPVRARGWCNAHYQRWRTYGDPLGSAPKVVVDHPDGTRSCTSCGEALPLESFDLDKRGSGGRRARCKPCRSTQMKTWYAENRERQRDRQRERVAADRDKARRTDVERYRRHRAKRIAIATEAAHRRRALLADVESVPGITVAALRERHGDQCCYCGVALSFDPAPRSVGFVPTRATVEHVVPLSKGGAHTWENTTLACWRCNVRRGNREVFADDHGRTGPAPTERPAGNVGAR